MQSCMYQSYVFVLLWSHKNLPQGNCKRSDVANAELVFIPKMGAQVEKQILTCYSFSYAFKAGLLNCPISG
jgi:hypothetical protein